MNRTSILDRIRRALGVLALTALAVFTTGCANFYVDSNIKDMSPEQVRKVASPQSAQLIFEFQTKGTANARATQELKTQVTDIVKKSGMFSSVSEGPAPGGAVVSIVINNIVLTDDVYSKGFITGMTFGLAGSTVTDGYVCTVSYLGAGSSQKVSKEVRHAIHTSLGASGTPPTGIKAAGIKEAVETMVRQIVSNGLDALAADSSFR